MPVGTANSARPTSALLPAGDDLRKKPTCRGSIFIAVLAQWSRRPAPCAVQGPAPRPGCYYSPGALPYFTDHGTGVRDPARTKELDSDAEEATEIACKKALAKAAASAFAEGGSNEEVGNREGGIVAGGHLG